jgi:hypothetical protein
MIFVGILALPVLVPLSAQQATTGDRVPLIAPTDLSTARKALGALTGRAAFHLHIEGYAFALPFEDSLALIFEFTPKADPSRRQALYEMGGDVALAGGNFNAAADFYLRAAEGRPEFLLKAVRCRMVAGDAKNAEQILLSIPDALGSTSFIEEKRLLLAWMNFLNGDLEAAFSILRPFKEGLGNTYHSRQALLLLWIISMRPEFASFGVQTKGFSTADIREVFVRRFPTSIEVAIVQNKIHIRPSALLLAGLAQKGTADLVEHSMGTPLPQDREEGSPSKNMILSNARLQVGLFSRKENAIALTGKLKNQGFTSMVDERSSLESETRWAVIVETGTDWMGTLAKLKDLGYETYLLP